MLIYTQRPAVEPFRPIEIVIKVETRGELVTLRDMCEMDSSIPEAVSNYRTISKDYSFGVVRSFLHALHEQLCGPDVDA
jgi:hypothetical protein